MTRLVQLAPKNNKAKNKIHEAGHPSRWIVLEQRAEVAFSEREGPWLKITPEDTSHDHKDHSRWVNQHNDTDFIVKEV